MEENRDITRGTRGRLTRQGIARYLVTGLLFAAWIIFVDPYSLATRVGLLAETRALERERDHYLREAAAARRKIEELRGNRDKLEKFAREQHLMKRPDEDLYILTDN
jgi:cell division protein FtsB